MKQPNSRKFREPGARRAAGFGVLKVIVYMAVAAVAFYFLHEPFDPPSVANSRSSHLATRRTEFEALFQNATPLASLSRPGQYTVVEVYIDGCMWCREFEAAFDPFQDRRADVTLVQVHHPGEMSVNFDGSFSSDPQREYEIINSRMESYGLCGTPHVEVYGPKREPLAIDSCASRAGTEFIWKWITHETGIRSRRSVGWAGVLD